MIARSDGSVALQLRGRRRRRRDGDHRRDPRRRPPLQHAQAAARLRGPGSRRRRATRTCRCCTARTARSSPSATAPPRSRSCAIRGTCRPRSATTWRCSAGAPTTTATLLSTDELRRALLDRARRPRRRRLRRAEAALGQRPLHARDGARRVRAAARRSPRAHRSGGAPRPSQRPRRKRGARPARSSGEGADGDRGLAADRLPVQRAADRRGRLEEGDEAERARAAAARGGGARRRRGLVGGVRWRRRSGS